MKRLFIESKKNNIIAAGRDALRGLPIDKGIIKGELCKSAELSSGSMTTKTNGEFVNLSVMVRICEKLDCDFTDLVNYKNAGEN